MASSEHKFWIWAAVGVAVGVAAGVAAWAPNGFMAQGSDAAETAAAGAPLNLRRDVPAAVTTTAPDSVAVGAAPSAPAIAPVGAGERYKLVGVMISGNERMVLISVDGKPARMFRVGETVDGDIVVLGASERGTTLGPRVGGAAMALEMSQALPAATVAAPAPTAKAVPRAPLADGSAQSQDVLRKLGSKHAPLQPPKTSAPQKPIDDTVTPVDDGRWKPPGQ